VFVFFIDKQSCNSKKRRCTEDASGKISLKDLLEKSGIKRKIIKKPLTYGQLSEIARTINFDWKSCASKLGVSTTDITDIEEDYHKVKEQRRRILRKWKQKKSFTATGKAFVKVLWTIGEVNQAYKVCLLLKN